MVPGVRKSSINTLMESKALIFTLVSSTMTPIMAVTVVSMTTNREIHGDKMTIITTGNQVATTSNKGTTNIMTTSDITK
jgi:hypothetical protein